jgi:hypothetical protein
VIQRNHDVGDFMSNRAGAVTGFLVVLLAFSSGCRKTADPGVMSAGPYPQSREIVSWLRVTTGDHGAMVVHWGPREELAGEAADGQAVPVLIAIRYRTGSPGTADAVWSQKVRVANRRVTADAPAVKADASAP